MPLSSSTLPSLATAAVMAGACEKDAPRHVPLALRRMHLVQHAVLAATVAGDLQEPTRKGRQRLVRGFLGGG
jgi:hypothetical protein